MPGDIQKRDGAWHSKWGMKMNEVLLKYLNQFTTLNEEKKQAILDDLHIENYKKGTCLLRQGDVPTKCYFVLKGCVRQYGIDQSGKEVTSNFYIEEQAITSFSHYKDDPTSQYSFVCLEDSTFVIGDLESEKDMYDKHSQLGELTRKMLEMNFAQVQDEFASFIQSSPEERYKSLLVKRPQLIDRVPQHQLASYLGITPESLSRIKKRIDSHKI